METSYTLAKCILTCASDVSISYWSLYTFVFILFLPSLVLQLTPLHYSDPSTDGGYDDGREPDRPAEYAMCRYYKMVLG